MNIIYVEFINLTSHGKAIKSSIPKSSPTHGNIHNS